MSCKIIAGSVSISGIIIPTWFGVTWSHITRLDNLAHIYRRQSLFITQQIKCYICCHWNFNIFWLNDGGWRGCMYCPRSILALRFPSNWDRSIRLRWIRGGQYTDCKQGNSATIRSADDSAVSSYFLNNNQVRPPGYKLDNLSSSQTNISTTFLQIAHPTSFPKNYYFCRTSWIDSYDQV